MNISKYAAVAAFLSALSMSTSASACVQLMSGPLPPGSALPPGVVLCPPVTTATPFSASRGNGYNNANAKGQAAIADNFQLVGTIDGDTLNVTSISGGEIQVNMKLSGQGLPPSGITVTAFGTGTGGVGTYKVKTN